MIDKVPLNVRQESRQTLVIDGLEAMADPAKYGQWAAYALGEGRFLLRGGAGSESTGQEEGLVCGRLPVEALVDVLRGLAERAWTGMLALDTGFGLKRLYLRQGELIFAASNIIDDRLGEVIFRDGMITIDQLTHSAAKVTRTHKFGQVLLASGVFDPFDLWKALCLQVRQIVYSIFMVDFVYLETSPEALPPTEVVLPGGARQLIEEAQVFGSMLRGFTRRLNLDSEISLLAFDESLPSYQQGTYVGDFITLLRQTNTVGKLLDISKVCHPYTMAALLLLVNKGLCQMEGLKPLSLAEAKPAMAELSQRVSSYEAIVHEAQQAFHHEGKSFPSQSLRRLAASLNADEAVPVLFLSPALALDRESLAHIYHQCCAQKSKLGYFISLLDCLIRFTLQVSEDLLSADSASRIRQTYRNIASP